MRKTAGAIALGLASLAPGAAPAQAAQRYASPAGAGLACTAAEPCSLDESIYNAAGGDEVIVAPGDYSLGRTLAPGPGVGVDVHGVAGAPVPRISSNLGTGVPALLVSGPTSLRHLRFEWIGQSPLVIADGGALTVDGVVARGQGGGTAIWLSRAHGSLIRDSLLQVDGAGGTGLLVERSLGVAVRNVTALAGLDAVRVEAGTDSDATAEVRNTIARGGARDVAADQAGGFRATLEVDWSNVRASAAGGTGTLVLGTHDQSAEPVFADGAGHQAAGSPTVDAGIADGMTGATDLDGDPRPLGAATDIGADELVPPPPPSPPTPPPGPGAGPQTSGAPGVAAAPELRLTIDGRTLPVQRGAAMVRMRCIGAGGSCRGELVLRPRAGNARSAARAPFAVRAGSARTVAIRLPRYARRSAWRRCRLVARLEAGGPRLVRTVRLRWASR